MQFVHDIFMKTIFIVWLCTVCYSKSAVAWDYTSGGTFPNNINCGTSNYGTDNSLTNGPWAGAGSDPLVYRLVNARIDANENFISLDFQAGTETNPSGESCNYKKCRIKKDGNYANKCGAAGGYHAERMSCASEVSEINNTGSDSISFYDSQPFRPVPNNRSCIDFPFGPIIKDTNNVNKANLNKKGTITLDSSLTPSSNHYTWHYNNDVSFDFTKNDIQNNGTCTYNKTLNGPVNCLSYIGWSVSNFTMRKTISNNDNLHCASGSVVWTAETTAGGNAASGFYAVFKESSDNNTNPKITCNHCYTGWKPVSGLCDGCDASKNFASFGTSYCWCKKGFAYDSSQDRCVPRAEENNFVPVGDNYYCKQGYKLAEYNQPTSARGYQRFYCTACDTDKHFHFNGEGCICDDGYTINGEEDTNPENHTRIVNTNASYQDMIGTFRLASHDYGVCGSNWWESSQQENP